jgi:hypothetical protein
LFPTGLLVAVTGKVSEQLDIITTSASDAKIDFAFIFKIWFCFPTIKAFRNMPRFF